MKLLALFAPPLLLAAACTAQVSHPTKSLAEQQADIDLCTKAANRKFWMDPVAALYNAYDCLEAKGYRRDEKDFPAKVERALGERPPARHEPGKPCHVPCT